MTKSLSKAILIQLTKAERQKLERLRAAHQTLGVAMEKAQKAYTQMARKQPPQMLAKLAGQGFKYQFKAYEAKQALEAYAARLLQKYK